jgi:predicted metalloprotease
MQWRGRRESSNVDDRRGGGGRMVIGGGIGTIVIVIIALLLGKNPLQLLEQTGQLQQNVSTTEPAGAQADDEAASFVKVVLADTEDVWHKLFGEQNATYKEPVLVLFRGEVSSACGNASAASGPFYCSGDERLYIDLSFYDELKNRFNAPGDFAMAYVVAHEVGHHVQHLLGITDKVHAMRDQLSEDEYNKLSVKLELQADFLAGVWAHHADQMKKVLDEGDIQEALDAANAIGDDRLQKQAQGYVVPDAFTHGTSEQRMRWFMKGYTSGDMKDGDTFSSKAL